MQEERLAELLERYHSGESNAATSRELECVRFTGVIAFQ